MQIIKQLVDDAAKSTDIVDQNMPAEFASAEIAGTVATEGFFMGVGLGFTLEFLENVN